MQIEKTQQTFPRTQKNQDARTVKQDLPSAFRVVYFRNLREECLCKASRASSEGRHLDAWSYRLEAGNYTF